MGNYPARFPVYGAINEDQQWVIDRHLDDAGAAGVDVFAVNWYRDEYHQYGVARMKESTSSSQTKFCIQWSNHYDSMDAEKATKTYLFEGVRRAAIHMQSARYWTRNGKPVLMLLSATHLDDVIRISLGQSVAYTPSQAETNALVSDIRNIVGNVLDGDSTGGITGTTVSASSNAGPYLVLMTSVARWIQATGVDATTSYNTKSGTFPDGARLAHSFYEMRSASIQRDVSGAIAAQSYGRKFWPCLMAGWDARAWGGTSGDALADNCSPTTEEFIEACRDARVHAQFAACDKTVFLYAWNEFGEGGYVQPTAGRGNAMLNAVSILKD